MVIIDAWDDQRNGLVTHYMDDNTPWEIYKEHWIPRWQLRSSEGVELGLPGFSRNISIHVIPPQHLIGRMHHASTIASRQKLVEMGDLSRIEYANREWFDQQTQTWEETPAWNYFQINRMRTLQSWPNQDPNERLFNINYEQYKAMWYNICLWTDRYKYYYCMISFSVSFIIFPEPDWLADWWQKFGLNPTGIDSEVTETTRMFLFPNRNLQNISDLYTEEEYKMLFIRERHPWIIRTKYVLHQEEDSNEDPTLYREVYTQH